jgi:hypothetical protein
MPIYADLPMSGTTFHGPTVNVTVQGRASGPVGDYTLLRNGSSAGLPHPQVQVDPLTHDWKIEFVASVGAALGTGTYFLSIPLQLRDQKTPAVLSDDASLAFNVAPN